MTNHSILIVDDDDDIRATLSDFLEEEGYVVGAAANGRDALEYLRAHPATSLVLLDLMMPIMNGYEFRTEQVTDPTIADVPIVVMTARGKADTADLGLEHIVHKPFKMAKLLETIQRVER